MGSIIFGGIVVVLLFLALKKLYKDTKSKKCKGGCYDCANARTCAVLKTNASHNKINK